jgi:hypothetical protein
MKDFIRLFFVISLFALAISPAQAAIQLAPEVGMPDGECRELTIQIFIHSGEYPTGATSCNSWVTLNGINIVGTVINDPSMGMSCNFEVCIPAGSGTATYGFGGRNQNGQWCDGLHEFNIPEGNESVTFTVDGFDDMVCKPVVPGGTDPVGF